MPDANTIGPNGLAESAGEPAVLTAAQCCTVSNAR
jgi:hypothetical protein